MKKIINIFKFACEWILIILTISIIGFTAMVIAWTLIALILYIVWVIA